MRRRKLSGKAEPGASLNRFAEGFYEELFRLIQAAGRLLCSTMAYNPLGGYQFDQALGRTRRVVELLRRSSNELRIATSQSSAVIIRTVCFLAALVANGASQGVQLENYPFSIENENGTNEHKIVARNSGPAPVSVKLSITDFRNIASDRAFPIFAVVPPNGGTLYLARIRPAKTGFSYSFKTSSSWVLGDFNAVLSPDALYRLPYPDGFAFQIGQAPGGPITTHTSPDSQHAVDIPMPQGAQIVAARDGVVIYTEASQVYGGSDPDLVTKANEVRIQHVDGTIAMYAHLAPGGVFVYPGQRVTAGTLIGLAGSTGYSSGPHLHFAVQTVVREDQELKIVSLPFRFYVGNPPHVFPPQRGLIVRAQYSSPIQSPAQAVVAKIPPAAPVANGSGSLSVPAHW